MALRSTSLTALVAFALFSCSSVAATLPDSCVGNFCMFKPLTEKQFVERYGKGVMRSPFRDNELHYRCFHDDKTHQWAEFQFSRHGDREPRHLEAVTLGLTELCNSHYRSLRPMNLKIEKGAVAIGMSAKDVAAKLGPPSRIQTLSPDTQAHIFNSQFGDHAWVYETEGELLFSAIYIKDGKVSNFLLSNSE